MNNNPLPKLLGLVLALFITCTTYAQLPETDALLNQWHQAAAKSQLTDYFSMMSDDFVFVGTQADEVWNKTAFYEYSEPVFSKGKGWNMQLLIRNWYGDSSSGYMYFDELLDTQMGVCRGSGVFKKVNGKWKIAHYVLSLTIANDQVKSVLELHQDHYKTLIKTYTP